MYIKTLAFGYQIKTQDKQLNSSHDGVTTVNIP